MRSTDTIWYLLLPDMQRFYIKVTRAWFKTLIRKICDEIGKKRADIGTVTGARAELYFDGGWESFSFDAIKELGSKRALQKPSIIIVRLVSLCVL